MSKLDGPGQRLEKELDELARARTAVELASEAVEAAKRAFAKIEDEFVERSESAHQAVRQAKQTRTVAAEALRRARAERTGFRQASFAVRAARQNEVQARQAARHARRTVEALRVRCDDLAREIYCALQAEHPGEAARPFILDLARRRGVTERQMYRILMLKPVRRTEEEMREDLDRMITGRATPSVVARERGISCQSVWEQFQRYLVTAGHGLKAPGAS